MSALLEEMKDQARDRSSWKIYIYMWLQKLDIDLMASNNKSEAARKYRIVQWIAGKT